MNEKTTINSAVDAAEKRRAEVAAAIAGEQRDIQNDIDIISPVPADFELGGKIYKLRPLTIREMRLCLQLGGIMDGENAAEAANSLSKAVSTISELLGENDIDFLERNLTLGKIAALVGALKEISLRGVPLAKGVPPRG